MIDIHTHLHPERLGHAIRKWFAENSSWKLYHPHSPREVAAALKNFGVEKFVFFSYAHKPGIAAGINEWLTTTAKELDGAGLPLFTVHLDDEDYLADAKRAIANGCIGMKIHEDVQSLAIDDPRFSEVFKEIEKIDGFVLAHIGPIPWRFEPETGLTRVKHVKARHPELKIVVAHMGVPDTDSYFQLMEQVPNVFLDTTMSFSSVEGLALEVDPNMLERHAEKILFGSDYPHIPYEYKVEPEKIAATGISKEALAMILGENARRLLSPFI